ncbi:MAG: hypothetical protein ACI37Z_03305 [Candidatus Gastranaerophilaceae bacterium]
MGYNKKYGSNEIQKGKAMYDTVVLTKRGIHYVKTLLQDKNNAEKINQIRKYYQEQLYSANEQAEEHLKRTVLCDCMFDLEKIIDLILGTELFSNKLGTELRSDLGNRTKFRYFRALEYRRANGDFEAIENQDSYYTQSKSQGSVLTVSRFFGILDGQEKTMPVYMLGYQDNLNLSSEKEEVLINKIITNRKRKCEDVIYVYHNPNSIKSLVERENTLPKWRNQEQIIDIRDYIRIYLLPYGKLSTEYNQIQIQLSIPDKDMLDYWGKNKCFDSSEYIFAQPFVKEIQKKSQDYFISTDGEYNYIIGYLPELRHLRAVFRYYSNNTSAKPLVVICEEKQVDFFKIVFESIMKENKLYFLCSEFCNDIKKQDTEENIKQNTNKEECL